MERIRKPQIKGKSISLAFVVEFHTSEGALVKLVSEDSTLNDALLVIGTTACHACKDLPVQKVGFRKEETVGERIALDRGE